MGWRPFRKRREREFEELDRWRTARKLASSDVTDLGEQLAGLPDSLGFEASEHHRSALDLCEQARGVLLASATAEDVIGIEPLLVDARYHLAAARALSAGEPLPERRDPCFFDPRHGPSVRDASWSPRVGAARAVPACASDARLLEAGEEPQTRMIRVGDRYAPVHEVGGYQGALDQQSLPFGERNASYKHGKHQAQTELWAPGTRFGGGGGHDGGSTSQSSTAP